MKVIDLLNKIANGEEVPEKISYDNEIFVYDDDCRDYLSNLKRNWLFDDYSITAIVNNEVEILEKDKAIERLTKRLEESQLAFLQVNADNQKLNNVIKDIDEILKDHDLGYLAKIHKIKTLVGSDK